jgi:hypothetical protein
MGLDKKLSQLMDCPLPTNQHVDERCYIYWNLYTRGTRKYILVTGSEDNTVISTLDDYS